jgi:hypothetical protein
MIEEVNSARPHNLRSFFSYLFINLRSSSSRILISTSHTSFLFNTEGLNSKLRGAWDINFLGESSELCSLIPIVVLYRIVYKILFLVDRTLDLPQSEKVAYFKSYNTTLKIKDKMTLIRVYESQLTMGAVL